VIRALRAAGASGQDAERFAPHIAAACTRYSITTPRQVAAFLAQTGHESGGFVRLVENLNYTTPQRIMAVWPRRFPGGLAEAAQFVRNPDRLANRVYANRLGNGDETSGDGARYLGRGLIQLTGRANYMAAASAIGIDYKARPELVLLPEHAALTAAWFWSTAGCNALAEAGDFDATTRRINGPAMLGSDDRRKRYAAVLKVLA
jgi:putative chitinase